MGSDAGPFPALRPRQLRPRRAGCGERPAGDDRSLLIPREPQHGPTADIFPAQGFSDKCTDHPAERGARCVLLFPYRNPSALKEMAPPSETKMDPFQARSGSAAIPVSDGLCSVLGRSQLPVPPLSALKPDRGSRGSRRWVTGDAHLSFHLPGTKTEPECGARVFLV